MPRDAVSRTANVGTVGKNGLNAREVEFLLHDVPQVHHVATLEVLVRVVHRQALVRHCLEFMSIVKEHEKKDELINFQLDQKYIKNKEW